MMDGAERFNHEEIAVTDKRKAYEEKCDAQLQEWNAQIDLLKARADKAKAEAKIEYYKTIEDMPTRKNIQKERLTGPA